MVVSRRRRRLPGAMFCLLDGAAMDAMLGWSCGRLLLVWSLGWVCVDEGSLAAPDTELMIWYIHNMKVNPARNPNVNPAVVQKLGDTVTRY